MSIADKLSKIAENQQKVFDAGKAAGGGSTSDPAAEAVMALLSRSGTHITSGYFEDTDTVVVDNLFYSEFIDTSGSNQPVCNFMIVPPQVTHADALCPHYNNEYRQQIVLCLPKNPPVVPWLGDWSGAGGNAPPEIIYVPDESVDAYKEATNWAEFADIIKPMSELVQGG